ncbi:DUF1273 domain-containing protein [Bacillus carboniphilus]|uniref:DUF1273 domain-containing protein n=1 Tax=Bacillus carboniphilus TaxID=86663 RepID=A0ABY9JY35_9BACI|nr:DUF1273 domain-containing protein [Bacillus carboniphilus]WLR43694.1 DUF1273 domain-containing protein [Bacillus carboniphilus]
MKVVSLTGYKHFELGIYNQKDFAIQCIKDALKKKLIPLIEDGLEWVLLSGHPGVELWGAEVVLALKDFYPQLKLAVVPAFLFQHENWKEETKGAYEKVVSQADFHQSVTNKGYESPEQYRLKNMFLTSKSEGLIIVFDEEKTGSPKYQYEMALKKQQQQPYEIIRIGFDDLQEIADEYNNNNYV